MSAGGRAALALALLLPAAARAADAGRRDVLLDQGWRSAADDADPRRYDGFEKPGFDDSGWRQVEVPHNWDEYEGDHWLLHGDRHGWAWYRRSFEVPASERGRRLFLLFEGVGSYATVWVNGRLVGRHAGGRTTFTLDITDVAQVGGPNLLAVRADHPRGIKDLPWVCGGDEPAIPGFSEGTQPMGIFRPVHLVSTGVVRIDPFGVHVWNDADATAASAVLHVETEIRNYDSEPRPVHLETRLLDGDGRATAVLAADATLGPGRSTTLRQEVRIAHPHLWSLDDPHLYTLRTTLAETEPGKTGALPLDNLDTPFGIRTIRWPSPAGGGDPRFFLDGKPVFINGVAEYEHDLGHSHAFTAEQIRARALQIRAAGFNAFRDAHQPHNLRYQGRWERMGILWWPQFAAHIWFDNPAFRANFKSLLRDWVKERRNSPSLVLWGLENESTLPPDFARECCAIIRELDPTASSERRITTCNGGKGADWNVPQNWSGTYGGNPARYADDLKRERLVGEYGAWRSIDYHSEGGFLRNGPLTEDRMAGLLETKIRLGESARNEACGQFMWVFATHENPGRAFGRLGQQRDDGIRLLDQIGPANNKGLLTLWGEPTDAYYLYRSNYVPARLSPMVCIVSHTWPDRWKSPGLKRGIEVYSNCDQVELFNDYRQRSLGRRVRDGIGTHFEWDNVEIDRNVLYAEGFVGGRLVATDSMILDNLPEAPRRWELNGKVSDLTAPAPGQHYLYRVDCGGPDYRDVNGNLWLADRDLAPGEPWGSESWAEAFPNVPPDLGSRRKVSDPIVGTRDDPLFRTFRYGRDKLRYRFAVPPGRYRIELYFIEPWYGRGGGLDCTGWRLFDVAVNGRTALRNLDLWREAGYCHALKKVVYADARGGEVAVSFPRVASYQAVISAIAVSTANPAARIPPSLPRAGLPAAARPVRAPWEAPASAAQSTIYPAADARLFHARMARAVPRYHGEGYAEFDGTEGAAVEWTVTLGLGGTHDVAFRYWTSQPAHGELTVVDAEGSVVARERVHFPLTVPPRWRLTEIEGGINLNAGTYRIRLTLPKDAAPAIDSLSVN